MAKHHPENERVKRRYAVYMREADGYDEATVDAALAAIHRFEEQTSFRDFKTFRHELAVAFKHHLEKQTNVRTGKPLAKSTLLSILAALTAFFFWLAGRLGESVSVHLPFLVGAGAVAAATALLASGRRLLRHVDDHEEHPGRKLTVEESEREAAAITVGDA